MKKLILLLTLVFLTGCGITSQGEDLSMYKGQFFDTFDTVTTVSVPASSQEEADALIEEIHNRYMELHQLYDKYNDYPGVVNIKMLNERAHKEPMKVEKDLMDLLVFAKESNKKISPKVNIAMGSVLDIWSRYRDGHEAGLDYASEHNHSHEAQLPPLEELKEGEKHCNIDDVVLDQENHTVFLKDPKLQLDVGAVAKGFATEIVARELEAKGIHHGILSAGGNVRCIGKPLDPNKANYVIGLQNPEVLEDDGSGSNTIDIVFVHDTSVVSSGDYQRYYVVNGKRYHHIIDEATLFPAEYFRGVSVVTKDSGLADFLSTTIFLLPYEEGRKLVDSLPGVEAYWIFPDMRVEFTDGLKDMLASQGASN